MLEEDVDELTANMSSMTEDTFGVCTETCACEADNVDGFACFAVINSASVADLGMKILGQ